MPARPSTAVCKKVHTPPPPLLLTVYADSIAGKQRINESVSNVQETKDAAAKNVMGKVDTFDRKVEAEASKAKSGVAGWFGK